MMTKNTRSIFSIMLPLGLLFLAFSQWQTIYECADFSINASDEKQKGAHLFGRIDSTNLTPLVQDHYNWITLVPYGSQKAFDSPHMNYIRGDSLAMLRRDSAWQNQIDLAHSAGFKVFLKPHIWLYSSATQKWRSDIFPSNEDNWIQWKKSYRAFILHYAKIAERSQVELFCIGTELSRLSIEKPEFWIQLIQEVRRIYTGKISYAANWYEEYERITFWEDLDYIGIQAYFPLVKNNYPSVEELSQGWTPFLSKIEGISKKYNRKILFTELGYKSTADSAIEPWQWIEHSNHQDKALSYETQANCYQAFFDIFWQKEWFAGLHIWQLRSDFVEIHERNKLDFTPQGKAAAKVIAKGFE